MEEKSRGLDELELIDDFDRLKEKAEELANGDEALKLKLLTKYVIKGFVDKQFREARERKLLPFKENRTNCGDEFFIPKKIRSKVPPPYVSRIDTNKSVLERCYFGAVEEKGEIGKKPTVKADRLEKKRKVDSCLEEEARKKKKRTIIKKTNLDDQLGLNPPLDLPQEFKDRIERLKGTNVMLVAQKELTKTDMNNHQSRFSVPSGQVMSHDFLSEEEMHTLSQKGLDGISCSLIQPCLEEIKDLELKKWDMTKTFIYTLIKKWKSIAYNAKNQLEVGSKVQLWSFRVDSDLWFAMVKLKEIEGSGTLSTSVSSYHLDYI